MTGFPSYTTDPFYSLATNSLGAAAFSPSDGAYNVDIVQLWDGATAAQNQMVYLGPIPDSASTGGVLALACGGLVLLGWRFKQSELSNLRVTKRV